MFLAAFDSDISCDVQLAPAFGGFAMATKLASWAYERARRAQGVPAGASCIGNECFRWGRPGLLFSSSRGFDDNVPPAASELENGKVQVARADRGGIRSPGMAV